MNNKNQLSNFLQPEDLLSIEGFLQSHIKSLIPEHDCPYLRDHDENTTAEEIMEQCKFCHSPETMVWYSAISMLKKANCEAAGDDVDVSKFLETEERKPGFGMKCQQYWLAEYQKKVEAADTNEKKTYFQYHVDRFKRNIQYMLDHNITI